MISLVLLSVQLLLWHILMCRAGYMPQDLALYDSLSIAETFLFHATLHGLARDVFKDEVRKIW